MCIMNECEYSLIEDLKKKQKAKNKTNKNNISVDFSSNILVQTGVHVLSVDLRIQKQENNLSCI